MKRNKIFLAVSAIIALVFFYYSSVTAQVSTSQNLTIVAFGDSLVQGEGAGTGRDFVSELSNWTGRPIINAGVKGDTTASALTRVDRDVLSLHPNIVIVFLGANDFLQKVPKQQTFSNLRQIVDKIRNTGAKVILLGQDSVLGEDYGSGLRAIVSDTGVAYVPNVLDGIIGNPYYTSIDSLHPNDSGHWLIADRVLPTLNATINSVQVSGSGVASSTSQTQTAVTGNLAMATSTTVTSQGLTATCTANSNSVKVGQSATWSVSASGGNGNYTYVWSGSNNLSGSSSSATTYYSSEGSKNATVMVTSGSQQVTVACPSVDVQEPSIMGYCSVSVSGSSTGIYYVNWNSYIFNNTATTTSYSWTGTDGLSANTSSISKQYTTTGLKTATVNVVSGNQTIPFICSVDVHSNLYSSTTPLSGSCTPTVNGMTVTWSASASGGPYQNGSPSYTYIWSGAEGFATTTNSNNYFSPTQTYTTEGTKIAVVRIQSGSEYLDLACSARVASTTTNGGHCFIATAVFGTPLEPEVYVLRQFRDKVLLKNIFGRIFVKTYYFVSPPVADYIRHKSGLRLAVRTVLEPIIYLLKHAGYDKVAKN